MAKPKKSEIEFLIEELKLEDLRLRIEVPNAKIAKEIAVENLKATSNRLAAYIVKLDRVNK
jgi:hypothetical protein